MESIPDEMSYRNGITPYPTTYSVWLDLLAKAAFTVEIASYYWELRDGTAGNFPTGDRVFGLFYIISFPTLKSVEHFHGMHSITETYKAFLLTSPTPFQVLASYVNKLNIIGKKLFEK